MFKPSKGFTLIELLLAIGIIVILAAAVIITINPARQLAKARNAQRWSDVNVILNAVHEYALDNDGNLPSTVTTTVTEICVTGASSCTGLIDLSVLTNNGIYLVLIPSDPLCPSGCNTSSTAYDISKSSPYDRVTVMAEEAELDVDITVTR